MEREWVSNEEAFDMLRQASQKSNVKLREIAERVVREKRTSLWLRKADSELITEPGILVEV